MSGTFWQYRGEAMPLAGGEGDPSGQENLVNDEPRIINKRVGLRTLASSYLTTM